MKQNPNYEKAILMYILQIEFYININHPILKLFENDFSKIFGEGNETLLSILAQNMGEQDLADHDKVEDKFLLIPKYFEIKSQILKNTFTRATHKIQTKDPIILLQKIFLSLKEKTFKYGIRKKWLKFKFRDTLPEQIDEVYFYSFFPTIVYENIQIIYEKLKSLFSKGSDYVFEEDENEVELEDEIDSIDEDFSEEYEIIF